MKYNIAHFLNITTKMDTCPFSNAWKTSLSMHFNIGREVFYMGKIGR
jgi:hypothetical protein